MPSSSGVSVDHSTPEETHKTVLGKNLCAFLKNGNGYTHTHTYTSKSILVSMEKPRKGMPSERVGYFSFLL